MPKVRGNWLFRYRESLCAEMSGLSLRWWFCGCLVGKWPGKRFIARSPQRKETVRLRWPGGHLCFFVFSFFTSDIFIHNDSPREFNEMWRITHSATITTQSSAAWWPCLPLSSAAPQRISEVLTQETLFSSWSALCYSLPPNTQSTASNWPVF